MFAPTVLVADAERLSRQPISASIIVSWRVRIGGQASAALVTTTLRALR